MNNYKLTIQYDGRKYNGWQKQGNTSNTIQRILESTLADYLRLKYDCTTNPEISGSGRTDAGVHALAQTANFKVSLILDLDCLTTDLNLLLPLDIRITEVEKVDEHFHARLSATGKYYSYYIDNRLIRNVFDRNYALREEAPLCMSEIKKAALLLCGEHDFLSFSTASKTSKLTETKSTVRTIYDIEITENDGLIRLCFHGNGFLYNMVRILTGTLLEVGRGNISTENISDIIAKKDRAFAGPTVSPHALFLDKVDY